MKREEKGESKKGDEKAEGKEERDKARGTGRRDGKSLTRSNKKSASGLLISNEKSQESLEKEAKAPTRVLRTGHGGAQRADRPERQGLPSPSTPHASGTLTEQERRWQQ